jgi:hypothetical protein
MDNGNRCSDVDRIGQAEQARRDHSKRDNPQNEWRPAQAHKDNTTRFSAAANDPLTTLTRFGGFFVPDLWLCVVSVAYHVTHV